MTGPKRAVWTYDFPRPALTVDVVLTTPGENTKVLLIRRKRPPFMNRWALPGGFVDQNERLYEAVKRELLEETGIHVDQFEFLTAAGDPGRDPRGWTVSIVFLARSPEVPVRAGDDAQEAKWFPFSRLPKLAFDHEAIVERARIRLLDRTV